MDAPTRSELDKMRAGEPYRPGDPELVALRQRAQRLMRDYNQTVYGEDAERQRLLTLLFAKPVNATIRLPIKEGENIERSLKKFKRKFEKTGVIKELRSRQAFIKPSISKRQEKLHAIYIQHMQQEED
jgi:small subunit ribosomal protein S21